MSRLLRDDILINLVINGVVVGRVSAAMLNIMGAIHSTDDIETDANVTAVGSGQFGSTKIDNGVIEDVTGDHGIQLRPGNTEPLVLDNLNWPKTDGTANQVLKTDGAGQLGWADNGGGGGTVNEDEWAPVLSGSTTAGSPTGAFTGYYRETGGFVTLWFDINLTALGGMAGNIQLTGLPYLQDTTKFNAPVAAYIGQRLNLANEFSLSATLSGSTITLLSSENNGTPLTVSDLSATTRISGSITYMGVLP